MKRIKLTHGTARVDDNVSQETIDALNDLSEKAFEVVASQHMKLQHGDYVEGLTEDQHRELLDIEWHTRAGSIMSECCGFIAVHDEGYGLHLNWYESDRKTKLTFEEFKQRAINTF